MLKPRHLRCPQPLSSMLSKPQQLYVVMFAADPSNRKIQKIFCQIPNVDMYQNMKEEGLLLF